MTLSVSVHQRDADTGELGPDLVAEAGAGLGGFEVWRTSVYGSDAVRRRGAHFLPQLASANLMLEGDELALFRAECVGLIGDVQQLGIELGVGPETLSHRLSNFVAAADQAMLVGGVVWIA